MKLPFFIRSLAYNLDTHRANPANLAAGALGMVINNILFYIGIWAMFFAGKTRNEELLPYFITLQVVVMTAVGFVTFFFGGLRSLPEYVIEGDLEPMLATPRHPIFLAAVSRSGAAAFGDFLMGSLGIVFVAWKWGGAMACGSLVAVVVSSLGFAAVSILAGALAFFIPRGNQLGHLLTEITLSMSVYPTGKIFSGAGRWALLLTPAAVTAVLPMEMVEKFGFRELGIALFAALFFFTLSVGLFQLGLKRYRAVSLIGARR